MEQTPPFTAKETSSIDMMEIDGPPEPLPVEQAATAAQDDVASVDQSVPGTKSEAEAGAPADATGDVGDIGSGVPSSGVQLILYRTAQ